MERRMKPLVSVVLSVYKNTNLEFFKQAIDSLLTQTFKDFEIVLIIDGEIPFLLKEYIDNLSMQKKDFIRVFKNPVNKGLAFSLNRGIKEARGKYIARMDDDEICVPERLEVQYRVMEETGCDICFSNVDFIDISGNKISTLYSNRFITKLRLLIKDRYKFLKKIIIDDFIMHPSVMLKKDKIMKINGYDESLLSSEDYDLWIKCILNNFKFEIIDYPLIYVRIAPQRDLNNRITKILTYFYWDAYIIKKWKKEIIKSEKDVLKKLCLWIECKRLIYMSNFLHIMPTRGLYLITRIRDLLIGYRSTR